MKRKTSLLWIYILLAVMFLEMMFVIVYVGSVISHSADEVLAVSILYRMIVWWKCSFAAVLMASFCCVKTGTFHTIREFLQLVYALVMFLVMKVLFDTLLLVVSALPWLGFSAEYLWICFGRMVFYIGILGILAMVLGIICAVMPFRGMGYALAGLAIVFFTTIILNYRLYNINYYAPCPVKNPFVFEEKETYSSLDTYGGLKYEEYEGVRQAFRVTEYDLKVSIDREYAISGKAAMTVSDGSLSEYVFRLNAYMTVERVRDENGNQLCWEQSGNYVTVFRDKEELSEIVMNYHCNDTHIIPVEHHYVSLPSYLMWYPAAPDMQSNYTVNVNFDYEVYCNLDNNGRNCFEGNSCTVSLLSGSMIRETNIAGVRIIYPGLLFQEEYVRQYYMTKMIQMPQRQGDDIEGFDWFVDTWGTLSFWEYYDVKECYLDGYVY